MFNYIPFLLFLLLIAALLHESSSFTLFYLLAGMYIAGSWWSRRALDAVRFRRTFVNHAFLGESVPVKLEVSNAGWLPVVWLRVHESLPIELAAPNFVQRVVSLGAHGRELLEYTLRANKRGYYRIGPLFFNSGDILGISGEHEHQGAPDTLTVYPKIVPLTKTPLPSHSPLGALKHTRPIFEDPARTIGKRDYVSGDSLRRVDWKATAASGRLQVKLFEPSVAVETSIILNLNAAEYGLKSRLDSTELAIVVAASLANWVINQKQAVGLMTNGFDPVAEEGRASVAPPRKGRAHLMRVLEVLARVQITETYPLVQLLQREIVHLSWGATLIVITGQIDEPLFEALFHSRRAGLNAVVIVTSPLGFREAQRRAGQFGFPVHLIHRERDLDRWRQ